MKRKYEYTMTPLSRWIDFGVIEHGFELRRQLVGGKDGRAYPRTLERFFGDKAEERAKVAFAEVVGSER